MTDRKGTREELLQSLHSLLDNAQGSGLKVGSQLQPHDAVKAQPDSEQKSKQPKTDKPKPAAKVDQMDLWIDGLDNLIGQQSQAHSNSADLAVLPTAEVKRSQRLVWNLTRSEKGIFQLELWLQPAKANGQGFNKGNRIALNQLLTDSTIPADDIDRRIATLIARDHSVTSRSSDDQPGYHLPADEALPLLIGCERFFVDHVATSLSHGLFPLIVSETREGGVSLYPRIENAKSPQSPTEGLPKTFFLKTCVVMWDQATCQMRIECLAQGTPKRMLIEELIENPIIPASKQAKFLEAITAVQNHLSLVLPVKSHGPLRSKPATVVVLLRCRDDWQLDFGIRFRDVSGRLHLPGEGPQVTCVGAGRHSYQAKRDIQDERRRAEKLVADFRLQADVFSQWFGTIDRLSVSLSFIETLQKQSKRMDARDPRRIEVMWDRSAQAQPIRVLGTVAAGNVQVEIESHRNWFGLGGRVKVDETELPLADLLEALAGTEDGRIEGDFVRLRDGQWARIEAGLRDRLERLRSAIHIERKLIRFDATAAHEIRELDWGDIEIRSAQAWQDCVDRLSQAQSFEPAIPKNLNAEMRDYQVSGYRWMSRLARWGVGGILADDMGLGKTLQTLAVLLDRSDGGPSLVIAPTSVGFNWVREAKRFAPDLKVSLYRETGREKFLPRVGPGHLVVCSYGLAMRDIDAIAQKSWHTLVLDEAQAIKNSNSKTSQAIVSIKADWSIALSGTPVENHLGELWSVFHAVSPGVLGSWNEFAQQFAEPIERYQDRRCRDLLARRISPFVLRRTKSEVLKELPPRTEVNLLVDLSPDERAKYEEARLEGLAELKTPTSEKDGESQRFSVLALVTRLRQLACHVGLVDAQWSQSSAKLDLLCETLLNLKQEGHRALVFSQFTQHLALIREALDDREISYEYLDGSTPLAKRQQAVDNFQKGTSDAFLISLKAGGTGLNLTAADYVIHMDPWWNPAVEDQATDRAHRMGQLNPVMVYRIIARRTIEEVILSLHADKRELVQNIMSGTNTAAKLSTAELMDLIRSEPSASTDIDRSESKSVGPSVKNE
jgi:SNF2 family DNA or RNA helicase